MAINGGIHWGCDTPGVLYYPEFVVNLKTWAQIKSLNIFRYKIWITEFRKNSTESNIGPSGHIT